MIELRSLMQPHRIVMMLVFAVIVIWCAYALRWDWLPKYARLAVQGIWVWLRRLDPGLQQPRQRPSAQSSGARHFGCYTKVLARCSLSSRGYACPSFGHICVRPGPMRFWR